MANLDFENVLETLKNEVVNLAMSTVNNYKNEAKADALSMVNMMKDNLRNWTLELANGEISAKDYEYLVLGQKELIEMNALKQAGLAMIQVDALKNSILNLIIKTVTGLI
jgi:nicotinamide riboside kinase